MQIIGEVMKQEIAEKERRSSLLRSESVDKWDMEEIESTMNDMQKELKHLMQYELNCKFG